MKPRRLETDTIINNKITIRKLKIIMILNKPLIIKLIHNLIGKDNKTHNLSK